MTTPHAAALDRLRLGLATLVLFSHCFTLTSGDDRGDPVRWLTRGQLSGGEVAVDLFFVISGYLIVRSWERSAGLKDYLIRRVRRIVPGFWCAALLCLLVVAPLGFPEPLRVHDNNALWKAIPEALLLFYVPAIPGLFPNHPFPAVLNGSLWSIKYEVVCYLLVAVLGRTGGLRRRGVVLALLVGFFGLYLSQQLGVAAPEGLSKSRLVHNGVTFLLLGDLAPYPRLVTHFLAGAALWRFRERVPLVWRGAALSAAGLAALAASGVGLPLAFPFLAGYAALWAGMSLRAEGRATRRHADLSYGMYLYAWPVQQLLVQAFGRSLTAWTLFLLALPPTVLLAALSWRFVEAPFLRSRA